MRKLQSVQVLRAIAAIGVVINHTTLVKAGAAGVDLFFVVSGFIIGTVMVWRTATEFATARLWRIFPIYYVAMLPWLTVAVLHGMITGPRLASSLTLWPIWGSWAQPYLGVAWTLCFEIFFYTVTTAAIALKRTAWIVPALVSLVGLNFAFGGLLLGFVGGPMILEFCAGLLLIKAPRHGGLGLVAIGLGFSILIASPHFEYDGSALLDFSRSWYRVMHWGIPAVLIAWGALSLEDLLKRAKALVAIGDASYSIYLTHSLIVLASPFSWPTTIALCLGVGLLMHRYVEKPLLAHKPVAKIGRKVARATAIAGADNLEEVHCAGNDRIVGRRHVRPGVHS